MHETEIKEECMGEKLAQIGLTRMAQETKECPHEFEYLSERSKDEDIPEQS
jgi:hypothetical protein